MKDKRRFVASRADDECQSFKMLLVEVVHPEFLEGMLRALNTAIAGGFGITPEGEFIYMGDKFMGERYAMSGDYFSAVRLAQDGLRRDRDKERREARLEAVKDYNMRKGAQKEV